MRHYPIEQKPQIKVKVLEKCLQSTSNAIPCVIGKHIKFDTIGLENYFYCQRSEPILYDLLLLAGAVEFCDRIARHKTECWERSFYLILPVHDPDCWNAKCTTYALKSVLGFLTGDEWNFRFVKTQAPFERLRQCVLGFAHEITGIIPFSNGLDSLAVAGILEQKENETLAQLRLGSIRESGKTRKNNQIPFMKLPYEVHPSDVRFCESSGRHRGFKFAALCAVASKLTGCKRIFMTESGQGALGPSLVTVGQSYPDYRSHPRFLRLFENFLQQLFDSSPRFLTPRLWNTKGETLMEFIDLPLTKIQGLWDTRSCWQQQRQVGFDGVFRQCGVCAACMLRRMSMHTAGHPDPADAFLWDDLKSQNFIDGCASGFPDHKRNQKSFRYYAIAGALHLDHLADLANKDPFDPTLRRESLYLSRALDISHDHALKNLLGMLKRHQVEWESFLSTLPENSFVLSMIGRCS